MKRPASESTPQKGANSASASIDERIEQLGDWRGTMLAKVREIIHAADPEIVEEVKWVKPSSGTGTPVFSHGGIVCTGETYKSLVKLTFAKGASLPDPAALFNSSLDGNVRRDRHSRGREGEREGVEGADPRGGGAESAGQEQEAAAVEGRSAFRA